MSDEIRAKDDENEDTEGNILGYASGEGRLDGWLRGAIVREEWHEDSAHQRDHGHYR